VHEDSHWSPVRLCDSTHRDKASFGNDMVTNVFDIDITLCLVCCHNDLTVSTSDATISTMINKGTMLFKVRC
jgi:hypothetical protein